MRKTFLMLLASVVLFPTEGAGQTARRAEPTELAVRAERLHTMTGDPIEKGVVLFRDGRIQAVGRAEEVAIPAGVRVVHAAVAMPGIIDAHATVGLTGYLNQPQDQDQLDRSEAIQPELRAIDAYNSRERLVAWVRSFGITTLHTGHAPGMLVSGQTMIVKTVEGGGDGAVVKPFAMIAVTLGDGALRKEGKSPGTRSKAVAMLREAFIAARRYQRDRERKSDEDAPERDLRKEALVRALTGEVPLLVTAHRQRDIMAALRLAREFSVRIVLDGASEAYLVEPEIKAAGVPVIVHPPMMRARGEKENAGMDLASRLSRAGIPFAFQSGFEGYVPKTRVVLFEAAIAASYGLGSEAALNALTIGAARILGIDERVGSLAPGKDADLALFDGDPLEYTTHCTGTIIDGRMVFSGRR